MYADRDGEEESYILGEYASLDEAIANMPNFFEVISEEKAMTIPYMKSAPNAMVDTSGLFIWPNLLDISND